MRPKIQLNINADPLIKDQDQNRSKLDIQDNHAEDSDEKGSANHHPLLGRVATLKEPNSATGKAFGEFGSSFKHLGKPNALGILKN